jgi:hypothetical protein
LEWSRNLAPPSKFGLAWASTVGSSLLNSIAINSRAIGASNGAPAIDWTEIAIYVEEIGSDAREIPINIEENSIDSREMAATNGAMDRKPRFTRVLA